MASLDMDCPWSCMGVGHTPGRGGCPLGVGAAQGCSHGRGAEDAVTAPALMPLPARCGQSTSPCSQLLATPSQDKIDANRRSHLGKINGKPKLQRGMWAEGEKGGESLKVLWMSAPNTVKGTGQECVPVPFPSTSRSSHQANH